MLKCCRNILFPCRRGRALAATTKETVSIESFKPHVVAIDQAVEIAMAAATAAHVAAQHAKQWAKPEEWTIVEGELARGKTV